MRTKGFKNRWNVPLASSFAISIIGLSNLILQNKETLVSRYMITLVIIFLICMSDWTILFSFDYFKEKYKLNKSMNGVTILLYIVFATFVSYWIIEFGNDVASGLDIKFHVQQNYLYRRCLAGITVSLVIFMINLTLILLEERQRIQLENERLLRESLQARFETLRQQVNPHFLFNSLSTLKTMMRTDIDKAEEYILRLSEVFRYSLQTTNTEKVTLNEEMNILNAYLFMLQGRFGKNLKVDIQIDDTLWNKYVPPFVLQILVENCVKHNIVSKMQPLTINIFNNDKKHLTVSNTLQSKTSVENSSGVGLANIEKRYQYLSGQHIEIKENSATFDVIIPLIN